MIVSRIQKLRTELVNKQKLSPDDPKVKEELEKVIEEITIKVAEQNRNKIMDNFKHLDQSEGERRRRKVASRNISTQVKKSAIEKGLC